ncbi:MAG: NAD(P)/FAD-dependent oxidoreductase [Myxococcales bacterium]|jgi:cation diffusion facilitator CzcD-associated flavoprotein CzcO|nr:NAD(P)/FAD-dependent oxidoreductase [Myxococcales bacterium]
MDRSPQNLEHFDVVVVGAGLSGIAVAHYLATRHPRRSVAILEARGATGGTWDLFRYPGIRSDSDLHTFGFAFKPWRSEKAIADGPAILAYLRETAAEDGTDRKIRFHHEVLGADWSSEDARWTVRARRTDTQETVELTCTWLFCASGYYRYDEGYSPAFPGSERFAGAIVHPQKWPEDLDYRGKRVVIVGSGATAVTLVPAMAEDAAHVVMLQRTPSYVLPVPTKDRIANLLKKVLPPALAYSVARRKNIARQRAIYELCQRYPRAARRAIRYVVARSLPEGYPVDVHFNPPYEPWDQRLCAVADGDLFRAIRRGRASVVTDHIDTFTERGILLKSGRELEADVIVTATGLALLPLGALALTVDGAPVRYPERIAFKGMMLDGVPNYAFAIGYTNSSWTLKVDLVCEHLCRLLAMMDERGYAVCRPERPPGMETRPLIDFEAGYVKRGAGELPRQGAEAPWRTTMSYWDDVALLQKGPVEDANLRFARAPR